VSNDNPYSEANFKTLKVFPEFPGRFGSIQDTRAFCDAFFTYYNHEHRHRALGLHTPASVHFGTAAEIRASRALVLDGLTPRTRSGSPSRRSRPGCPRPPGSNNRHRRPSSRRGDEKLSHRA
jgi:putative transposase